jgi:hypothetical protein
MKHPEELDKIPDIYYKALNYVFENDLVPRNGMWLEFGVYAGGSLNRIAKYANGATVYGFDSFVGLPEAWTGRVESWGGTYGPGTFSLGGVMPKTSSNVQLVKGWFKDSLPPFLSQHPVPVSFVHVDSDIYSSARDIFHFLKDRICDGCVIVFDELVGYSNFEEHEWRAWWEFVDDNGIAYEWIGGNRSREIRLRNDGIPLFEEGKPPEENVSPPHENVAVRILKNPSFGNF